MFFYIIGVVIPFNAILASIVSIITYFVYKRVSLLVQKLDGKAVDFEEDN